MDENKPCRESEIPRSMKELESAIKRLEEVSTDLGNRLETAMRNTSSNDSDKVSPKVCVDCDLAVKLTGFDGRIENVVLRLSDYMDRLEL